MARVLTAAAVERFKPTGKRRWIRDGGATSLFLVIQASGHKSWAMRFRRPDGKPGKLVLGPVDLSGREITGEPEIGMPLSLVGARQLAARIHRDRARGADVIADHKARRHRRRAEIKDRADSAFGTLMRRFVEEHARLKTRQWRSTAIRLGLHYPFDGGDPIETRGGLAERWADKPVRSIDGHDIHAVIDEAHRSAVPGVTPHNPGLSEARARGLHAALSSLFGWLVRHRWIDSNPCTNVWKPPPSKPRDRTLSSDEIRELWKACDAVPPAYGAAVKLLLLLGARLTEVSGMERGELSADGGVWVIPGSRAKNHKSCALPLPPLARETIASVPRISDRFVFSLNGHGPITGWSGAKHALDAAMGRDVPAWRLHDLRRTAVTGMVELGVRVDVVELVVNHISGVRAGVAGVYNKSELMPERREALRRWAAHVEGIVSDGPANIVAMPSKSKRGR
jgi:integrase